VAGRHDPQRQKNLALFAFLLGLAALFFALTMFKLGRL